MKSLLPTKIKFSAVIILCLLLIQMIFPVTAFAELNWDNPNSGSSPYKFSASSVLNSNMIMQVVGCTGVVNAIVDELKNVAGDLGVNAAIASATVAAKEGLYAALNAVSAALGSSVTFPGSGAGITLGNLAGTAAENTNPVPVQVEDASATDIARKKEKRESCLNGIAITLAKNQLTAMTRDSMRWINQGFNGDPLFVRNIQKLTNSIGDEILTTELSLFKQLEDNNMVTECSLWQEVDEWGDVEYEEDYKTPILTTSPDNNDTCVRTDVVYDPRYPYGRDYARSEVGALKANRDFTSAMISDMGAYVVTGNYQGATLESATDTFANNFSSGGWNGWLALTQKPQNNPLGYTMSMSQYIADKQATEIENKKNEILQNGGYLSQNKCILWYEKGEDGGKTLITTKTETDNCAQWEVITPGSTIQNKINSQLNSPERQTELAKTINDVLNALFSSLLGEFQRNGLSGLSSAYNVNNIDEFDYSTLYGGPGSNSSDFEDYGTNIGGNNTIDLATDLEDIIVIQGKYIKKIREIYPLLPERISKLGELDYCIPGPNKSWKTNIKELKDAYNNHTSAVIQKSQFVSGNNNNYTYLNFPASVIYENFIKKAGSDLWQLIKQSEIFFMIRPYYRDGCEGPSVCLGELKREFNQDEADLKVNFWSNYVKKVGIEYDGKIEATYGISSPMQTPLIFDEEGNIIDENPSSYLPMAQSGLKLAENLKEEGEGLDILKKAYLGEIAEVNINIYKLEKINKKVNAIIEAAQKERAKKRAEIGLPAMSEKCLEEEKITYVY